MVSAFTTSSLSSPLSSLWFEIQTKTDTEASQIQITQFSPLMLPPFCLAFSGNNHMVGPWSWGNCLKGSGKVPTPLPCGQAWATPLCSIFTAKKKSKKETVRSAAQKIREGKGCSARAGPAGKEKEKEEPLHPAVTGGTLPLGPLGVLAGAFQWVGKFRVRGLPAVCPHSGVGKGLVNNFFLVLTSSPLLSADCRGATASLLFPLSHLLMI